MGFDGDHKRMLIITKDMVLPINIIVSVRNIYANHKVTIRNYFEEATWDYKNIMSRYFKIRTRTYIEIYYPTGDGDTRELMEWRK